jgi:hypothetical protein
MSLTEGVKPMDHYAFMLEIFHALMDIVLPEDYAKPIRKEEVGNSGVSGQAQRSKHR